MNYKSEMHPLELAKELLLDASKLFECKEFRDVLELEYSDVVIGALPGIKELISAEGEYYYEVDDETASRIAIVAAGNRVFFELVRRIFFLNVLSGNPIPVPLRPVCSSLILGQDVVPKASGPTPGRQFALRYVATRSVQYLSEVCDLQVSRGDASAPESACDYVLEAMRDLGVHRAFNSIRDWMRPEKNESFELWAMPIDDLLIDHIAVAIGLKKRVGKRLPNVWGQLLEMHLLNEQR